eukprot:SAG25_NODE_241_length_11184_cov_4.090934_7_plen_78_part_00
MAALHRRVSKLITQCDQELAMLDVGASTDSLPGVLLRCGGGEGDGGLGGATGGGGHEVCWHGRHEAGVPPTRCGRAE